MKLAAAGLSLLLLLACADPHPMSGRWKGKDAKGQEVLLSLEEGGKFEAVSKGERLAGTWKVDSEAEPDRIDLIFESKTVSSIVKMQGDNLIIEPVGEDGKLPATFSKKASFYQRQP